jgi:hypothetical protein
LTGTDTDISVDDHSEPRIAAHRLVSVTTRRAAPGRQRSCCRA